ncbi:MAG: aldehyde dehydrogenase family protein [Pyrinomonadaceae bacterium]|nr:aldehyde dehydrogenase family protein [Blastocatellia bacterium]MCW5956349.1 aldehyde dehydrogenase family protein [Pyrinomonadaceae bacterium]
MNAVLQHTEHDDLIISFDPAIGEEIGRISVTPAEDVEAAVNRAREVFHKWKTTSFGERKALVMKAREVILAEMDEIAHLISRESGKPFGEAIAMEIAPVLDLMQWIARRAEKMLKPRRVGIGLYGLLGRSSKIIYKPYGVVGIIPAWNYPFSIPLGEAAMAVMAGNSVVIKPSELTPLVGEKIGEIFEKAGAPDGLVHIVHGAGETGAALVNAAPEKIMFTGSVATGKKIAKAAAENLTSTVLELGGKDPMIVFEDANLELAAGAAVWGAFCNAGQSCSSVERLYVHESVAEELTSLIVAKVKQLKQGRGDSEDISIGPMSSERQLKIVEDHVNAFRESGATIEIGGGSADVLVGNEGKARTGVHLFYEPTVISGATNDMRPMREETFGPTLPIATFKTEEEAIHLANDSEFGLTASVWTRDYAKGRRVAQQIEAGSVCINEVLYTHGIGQTPWGGFKNSGRGRTHGLEGLMELVQPQHIHTNRLALLPDAWWMPYTPTAVETFRGFASKFASGSIIKTTALLPQLLKRIRELMNVNREAKK